MNSFSYVPEVSVSKSEVVYFAGCMTHLQPKIISAMQQVMDKANVNYTYLDKEKSICCGRPLMLSGKKHQAQELMEKNKSLIQASGAKVLVTSCPICYNTFKKDYGLPITVLHHSEYLLQLVYEQKITVKKLNYNVVYHDPCELGRSSGIFKQPRKLLQKVSHLTSLSEEKEKALCCGGSLANLKISADERKKITTDTLSVLNETKNDAIITGCPLCKKTFSNASNTKVMDLVELVSISILEKHNQNTNAHKTLEEPIEAVL